LARHGVNDPDADWGNYAFLRDWDESAFLRSLSKAEETPFGELPPDGNRAVMLSTTSDAYQIIRHSDANRQKELNLTFRGQVRRALELIRDHSSLNVRILTRSPLAKQDFDLFQSLGDRLLLGVSLPTLRHDLTNIYEPCSPAPIHRLNLLKAARAVGISTCVAIAPTFPECDEGDLRRTLSAVAELGCMTLYHEPINIRAENVARIEAHAARIGKTVKTGVFASRESWKDYALGALHLVERLAAESGISDAQLKLWPDSSLGSQWVMKAMGNDEREAHSIWLHRHWSRPSQWPSHQGTAKHRSEAVAEYH
jgi:DNA repair photolyase